MRRVMYLMAVLLMSSMIARADETITVSATNSDIAANLDLKVVAKLFGEAKDLEDFETRLNNPDSAFVNLDLNGDGEVDYIRVIEVTSGTKHLIVLQAVLAKDIYQDIASIYVEKDEANNVSVQIIGDEYIYGDNYVIEPVYIYRPIIYDWFWSPYWVCWSSPWYWGYYPYWWHTWHCWAYWDWVDHCRHFHHHHHGCSFHYAQSARPAARSMGNDVRRNDYARANPGRSFSERNTGITNARQLPVSGRPSTSQAQVAGGGGATHAYHGSATTGSTRSSSDRTYGSSFTRPSAGTTRSGSASSSTVSTRSTGAATATHTTSTSATTTRSGGSSTTTTTRSGGSSSSTTRSSGTFSSGSSTVRSTPSSSTVSSSRSSSTSSATRSSGSSTTRSSGSTTSRPSTGSSTFSGGGSFRPSGGGSVSGGGSSRGGGGGGASPRR